MEPLETAYRHAREFLTGLPERRVGPSGTATPTAALGAPVEARKVIEELVRDLEPGLVATAGPRYFGFVTGGALPASVAADWLASTWDQNGAMAAMSPALAELEAVTKDWLLDLLGLPSESGLGFVTGGQTANLTCLLAARHRVLQNVGWDVEANGLQGSPEIRVIVGGEVHVAAMTALRYLGLGSANAERVETDDQGAMLAHRLELDDRPTIVLAQMGEVNTGAFDPLDAITAKAAEVANTWVHVDGAFGLWAAASPAMQHLVEGHDRADSWAVDGHKWLNVPYDSGYAIVKNASTHRGALAATAAYLSTAGDVRNGFDWVPESSRRGRAIPTYAALRQLGRSGVVELVDRCCALARRFAGALGMQPGIEILNDVVINQVLVRFGDDDARTQEIVRRVQAEGTCWLGGTTFRGRAAMRISVSNWSTTESDVDRSVAAILAESSRP